MGPYNDGLKQGGGGAECEKLGERPEMKRIRDRPYIDLSGKSNTHLPL